MGRFISIGGRLLGKRCKCNGWRVQYMRDSAVSNVVVNVAKNNKVIRMSTLTCSYTYTAE